MLIFRGSRRKKYYSIDWSPSFIGKRERRAVRVLEVDRQLDLELGQIWLQLKLTAHVSR